jgi:hypothetical protein
MNIKNLRDKISTYSIIAFPMVRFLLLDVTQTDEMPQIISLNKKRREEKRREKRREEKRREEKRREEIFYHWHSYKVSYPEQKHWCSWMRDLCRIMVRIKIDLGIVNTALILNTVHGMRYI